MKEIHLTKGKIAIIDDEDYQMVSSYKWYYNGYPKRPYQGYAIRGIDGKRHVRMHRYILGVTETHIHVDHINGNTLDNRRANLRICNKSENVRNRKPKRNGTSVYLGVHFDKSKNKWVAEIKNSGIRKKIGVFADEIDAAKAYDHHAAELHGEFANLNFK